MSYQQTVTVYSVEERMPPSDAYYVLAYVRGRGWLRLTFDDGRWFGEDDEIHKPTHWHELPGPPRKACEACEGRGHVMVTYGRGFDEYEAPDPCPTCKGTGSTPWWGQR